MSALDICNVGLTSYLGAGKIDAINSDTPAAEQCLIHYEPLRKGLLEAHRWEFAKRRRALTEATTNDRSTEWDYKYTKPDGILLIHWVNDPAVARSLLHMQDDPDIEREIYDTSIYCNVPDAYIEYTADITSTEAMPQYFQTALSAAVAAAVALPLTQNVKLAEFAKGQAEAALDRAITLDERSKGTFKQEVLPEFLTARGVR